MPQTICRELDCPFNRDPLGSDFELRPNRETKKRSPAGRDQTSLRPSLMRVRGRTLEQTTENFNLRCLMRAAFLQTFVALNTPPPYRACVVRQPRRRACRR